MNFDQYQALFILRPTPGEAGEYQAIGRDDGLIAADGIPATSPQEAFNNRHLAVCGTPEATGLTVEAMENAPRP